MYPKTLHCIGIALLLAAFVTSGKAQDDVQVTRLLNGSIIIVEGKETPALDFIQVNTAQKGDITFEITGEAQFANGSKKSVVPFDGKTVIKLPPIQAGPLQDESFLLAKVNEKSIATTTRVFTTKKDWFEMLSSYSYLYAPATEISGESFAIIDESKISIQEPKLGQNIAYSTAFDDEGLGAIIYDDGNIIYTKNSCGPRPFIPFTRNGYGIVKWSISNPRMLHTLKDENSGNNFASSLRCPQRNGPGTIDYYVDGIYNVLWGSATSIKVLKVPNHCTVTRFPNYFQSCCNAALSIVYGTAKFINPRERKYPDWPDNLRVCTLREP